MNAAFLDSISDTDDFPSGMIAGSLSLAGDVDWYSYEIEDQVLGSLSPRVELSNVPTGRDYQLCAFYACDSGDVDLACDAGSAANSGSLFGWCADASPNASVQLIVNCAGINNSGEVFVRISSVSGALSCDEYRLD